MSELNNAKITNTVNQEKQEDAFDLVGLLLEYLAQWKWFVICVIIALGCAYYYISTRITSYARKSRSDQDWQFAIIG